MQPGINPAAENTTVKPIIQRIKASPNHTDLIRQIKNWQVAVLADLPINAQNKAAFSLLTEHRQSEVARERVARRPDHRQLGRRGAAQTSWHREWLAQLRLAPAPLHLEPQKWPWSFCFGQVPLRLCSYYRGGVWLRTGTGSCAVHKEQQQLTWLGLKSRLEQTHSNLPPGPAFSSPTGRCLPCKPPDRASSLCGDRRLCRPASEPPSGPLCSDPEAICLKIGSLT